MLAILLLPLVIRTFLWHLRRWQINEYRMDRMREWLGTKDGNKNLINLWFFPGILPRPKRSARIIMIILFAVIITVFLGLLTKFYLPHFYQFLPNQITQNSLFLGVFFVLILDRLMFAITALSVFISKIPVYFAKQKTFQQAEDIINNASEQVTRIGIAGSYGKSSTKEMLVHVLQEVHGRENILFTPENENNELAIARLVIKNQKFFEDCKNQTKRFYIAEAGAFKRGEIKTATRAIKPHYSLNSGLNNQHISLFGSQRNILLAKFEMAEATQNIVFYNQDSQFCQEIFDEKQNDVDASTQPVSASQALDVIALPTSNTFSYLDQKYSFPWGGEFFIQNALLVIQLCLELGIESHKIAKALQSLPPLEKALQVKQTKSKAHMLIDLYSSNLDGVLSALDHLSTFQGDKYVVAMPLRELGKDETKAHEQYFTKMKEINITKLYWFYPDHKDLAIKTLGKNKVQVFASDEPPELLKELSKLKLKKEDAILLESKLPPNIEKVFG